MMSKDALDHLGMVLYYCADIHPDDRCDALDNALTFYNSRRPSQKVAPSGQGHFRMLHPLDATPPAIGADEIQSSDGGRTCADRTDQVIRSEAEAGREIDPSQGKQQGAGVAPGPSEAIGVDGDCFYCGERTQSLAGAPGQWPLQFCQPDGTGIARHHHTRCVTTRLVPSAIGARTREEIALALINETRTFHGLDPIGWDFPALSTSNKIRALRQADAVSEVLSGPTREETIALRAVVQFVADGWDNQDVNHEDFRVRVGQAAIETLEAFLRPERAP